MATGGTAKYFNDNGVVAEVVNKVREGRPHILDLIVSDRAQIVINTEGSSHETRKDSFEIRRAALMQGTIYFTTIAGAEALAAGLHSTRTEKPQPCTVQEWLK